MATNCTTCGCNTLKCGCKGNFLTTPAACPTPADCPTAQPCAEVWDAKCVTYTSSTILCGSTIVAAQNASVDTIIQSIVNYFCTNVPTSQITVVEAGTGITVTSTAVGNTTTYTVSLTAVPAKVFFHEEVISDIDIVLGAPSPGPDDYFFPIGYDTLTYTNTASTSKTFKVFVSYNTNIAVTDVNVPNFANWIDGAIIKTVASIDTIEWQSLGLDSIAGAIMDGPAVGDVVNFLTSETVVTTPSVNPVEYRFYNTRVPKNTSFYQVVTLAPNETVSLKFKSKTGSIGRLLQAQFMVEEI